MARKPAVSPRPAAGRSGHHSSGREDARQSEASWRYTWVFRKGNLARHTEGCVLCREATPPGDPSPQCAGGLALQRLTEQARYFIDYWHDQTLPASERQLQLF